MGKHALPRTARTRTNRRTMVRAASVIGAAAGTTLVGAGVVAAVASGIAFGGDAQRTDPALELAGEAVAADIGSVTALREAGVSRDERQEPPPGESDGGVLLQAAQAQTDRLTAAADAQARAAAAAEAERAAAEQVAAAAAAEAARVAAERAAVADSLGVDPDSNRGIAAAAIGAYGWGAGQFECLDALWQRESNWNHLAENPSSGAYGIPQSLPARKMATFGEDYRTNPATQIAWGLNYIDERYGTPCGAWSFWQDNNWY